MPSCANAAVNSDAAITANVIFFIVFKTIRWLASGSLRFRLLVG